MAVMAAILGFGPTILEKTFSLTIGPIVRHISYPFKCNSNVAKLKQELEELEDKRESVKNEVDAEIRDGGIMEKGVEKWITEMQKSVERLRGQLDAEGERIQKKCFGGLCPNIKARYQLSKQAEKEVPNLNYLRNRRPEFHTLTYQPDLPRIQDTAVKDYEAFDSRSNILKAIMDALLMPNSQVIGVYGTGGVGKTMLVQEVARQAGKSFDEVVVASVGSNPEIKNIQAKIVGELHMSFIQESVEARASRLREALKRKKKVLVILDNLWEKLNLTELGIPFKDKDVDCKILLTSRELDVLSNGMNCQKTISVPTLYSEEAWYLFKKKAGDCSQNPEILSIAQNICLKCGGLPLAISTVATALKDKSLSDWKDALRELNRPASTNFMGVSSEVYSALQLSYNHLASKELKSTFLLCCQMISSPVEYLVKYGMALSFFAEVFTIEEAQDRVKSLVHHLQASCLLEEKDGSIVIHDLLRDVGLSIASRDENVFFSQSEFDMKKWHRKHDLRSLRAISLQRCTQLPEELDCPELDFFSLVCEDRHLKIPDNIFKSSKRLKVLAITGHSLPFLPSSLVYLQNLQTLCLHDSELGDISIVGELKNLEFLSFRGSRFEHLPAEVGNLSELISLDLTDCHFLQLIPLNILSKLSGLQELWVENSFDQWENASLVELKHLPRLTNLAIHIRDHQVIPADFFSKKLKKYKIYIGNDWNWDSVRTSSNTLKLKLNADFQDQSCVVQILMKTVEELYLDQEKGVENILYQLNSKGFSLLKHLDIQNNCEIKHLVVGSSNWVSSKHAFHLLESLVLYHLVSLEKIHSGKISSFSRLRTLEVSRCPKMKYLFTCSVAKCLSNLQVMAVVDCMNLEMIVAEEDEATDDKIDFVQLRQLTLSRLPQLKCFLSKEKNTLTTEQITEEDNLMMASLHTSLFDAKVMFPSLEYLSLSCIEVENIWSDQSVGLSSWPRKLTDLFVEGCRNLLYLFPPSMVTSLVQLQRLEVRGCKCIEEIVLARGGIETTSPFPDLRSLLLENLSKLVTFCIGNFIELSSLKFLKIKQCPRMKAFITSSLDSDAANLTFFDKKVSVPNLGTLLIDNMHHLKMIWHTQFHPNSFCKLKILGIANVRELQSVFPSNSFLTQFCYLEELVLWECDYLETVFDKQMLIHPQESNSTASSSSSQLRTINILNLPNLKYIWNCIEISDNQGIVSFHNLRKVMAINCRTLEALFPVSVVKYLPYLEVLGVMNCEGLKEIVAKEDEEGMDGGVVPVFEFHGLTFLQLSNLPKVSTFYPGMHISEWPVLKKLDLILLPQMNIFEVESTQDSVSQPFLPFAKILPNLEELSLSTNDIRQLPAGLSHQLKCLLLSVEDDESTVFPFDLLHKFPHLETLDILNGNFNDLFPREEEEDGGSNSLGRRIIQQLRHLHLTGVNGLNHIWNPASQLDHLQNMETLKVSNCYNLIELAPSAASFHRLTVLNVSACKELQYILSPTTAKSLVQLTDMSVRDCDKVTEIVANEGDEIDGSIIFAKLASLVLVSLPSLSCFYSAKHSLKFPQLTKLLVELCPNMMVFSAGGALSAPKLERVQFEEYNESSCCWYGNLNGTVQMLFKEMVGFNSLGHLNLSEFPWLRDIWNGELPVKRFRDLKSLVVEGGSFSKAISSELLWFLNHLEVLRVRNCDLVDEVLDTDEQKQDSLLPSLTQLYLTNLPSLRRLWNERLEGISCFQNLKVVEIRNCGCLKHIFTRSMAMVLVHLEEMKVKDCISLEQIITQGVEDATLSDNNIIFPHLSTLVLERLPNLTSFCFRSDTLELPSMKELRIEQCPSMKTFITNSSDSVDAYSTLIKRLHFPT